MSDFRSWYRRNRKDLNKRRRLRYHTDPDYRDKVITRSREDYAEKSANRERADRRVFEDGSTRLISIGRLSEEINRKVLTVRKYHKTGVIPQPTHFDSRGWRLYTVKQYKAVVSAFDRFDRGILPSLSAVGDYLKENWPDD